MKTPGDPGCRWRTRASRAARSMNCWPRFAACWTHLTACWRTQGQEEPRPDMLDDGAARARWRAFAKKTEARNATGPDGGCKIIIPHGARIVSSRLAAGHMTFTPRLAARGDARSTDHRTQLAAACHREKRERRGSRTARPRPCRSLPSSCCARRKTGRRSLDLSLIHI